MKAWLVGALAVLAFACSKSKDQPPPARTAEPAPAKVVDPHTHRVELLARLDAALRKAAPTIAARLRPGATDAQIAAFEKYLGFALPDALKDLYRWHDGMDTAGGPIHAPTLFFGYTWRSLEAVHESHLMKTTMWKDGTYAKTERGGKGWWDEHWIPILDQIEGGTLCVDTAGWSTGDAGQIIEEWHDDSARKILFRDLDAWLETFTAALEAGVLHKMSDDESIGASDKTGDEDAGFERWVAYNAGLNPGYPKRLRAEGGH
jgi:cell wall assembly regulator SMI1